jgi:hypothetical protein
VPDRSDRGTSRRANDFGPNAFAVRFRGWRRRGLLCLLPGKCPGMRARRRLAAEAELAQLFVRFAEARLLDVQRFGGTWNSDANAVVPIAIDPHDGCGRVAARGRDGIGAVESNRDIDTADAISPAPNERFGALRFAGTPGSSNLRNIAAGQNGHSTLVETSGHAPPGTRHKRIIEILDPLILRETRIDPPSPQPSPVQGNGKHGQAGQPQAHRPLPRASTGHSRSLLLRIAPPASMIGCQAVRSTSYV